MEKQLYRYPGPQPFAKEQQPLFFGREDDIEALFQLVSIEKLVVLFSKSGLGKSSLINAGIIHKLEVLQHPAPLKWRFGAYTEGSSSPLEKVLANVTPATPLNPVLVKAFGDAPSVWKSIKNRQLQTGVNDFLVIIDQFEELFTYPEEMILEFKQQLSELLYAEIPNQLRQTLEEQFDHFGQSPFTDEELELIHDPFDVRLLLAIRSDRMSLLNNLTDYLPDVLRTCYELHPLNAEQAEEAILNPAFLKDPAFITPAFDYEDEAIEALLNFLSADRSKQIESFQLQLLCQALEKKVLDQKLTKIRKEDLEGLQTIFEDYYDNQIDLLETAEQRQAARQLLEEALIYEEEERRLSLYEGQIYQNYGFSPQLLQQLCNVHLLRAEPSLKGGYTYEIPHDTLVAPILKAKRRRLAKEKAAEEQRRQEERQQELAQLQREKEEANRKRRRALMVAVATSLLAVLATLSTIWAVQQSQRAKEAEQEALIEKDRAESLSDSLNEQLTRYLQASYDQLLAEGKSAVAARDFDEAFDKFQQALQVDTAYLMDRGSQAAQELAEAQNLATQFAEFTALMKEGDQLANAGTLRLPEALARYQQARNLELDENANQAAQNKIDALRIKIDDEFERLKERGLLRLRMNNTAEACRLLRQARQLNRRDAEVNAAIQDNCN